jgi:hypothetical protein
LLGLVAVFLTIAGFLWLSEKVPSSSMSSAADASGTASGLLLFASIIGATGWQYARRKTWASRGVLLGGVAAIAWIGVVTPYAKFVERKYPLVEENEAPAQIVTGTVPANTKNRNSLLDFTRDVYLTIPLGVSGVAPGKLVRLNGVRVTIDSPDGVSLNTGWREQWTDIWAEDERRDVPFALKRGDYERVKTATAQLHVELALAEYQETEVRDLIVREGEFSEPELGICRLTDKSPSQILCRRPFRSPGLMATFDPGESKCRAEEDEDQVPEDRVSHWWQAPTADDGPEPALNPVVEYAISPASRTWLLSSDGQTRRKRRVVFLCPGAKIRIAKPEAKRYARVKLEMRGVRLADLANFRFALD